MSDVIDFLEKLGQDSALRHASLEGVLARAHWGPEVRAALASGDQQALQALLGSGNVCCMVFAPLEEEQEEPQREPVAPRRATGAFSKGQHRLARRGVG